MQFKDEQDLAAASCPDERMGYMQRDGRLLSLFRVAAVLQTGANCMTVAVDSRSL